MKEVYAYRREKAVAYAHRWAFGRNPAYYDFSELGGDCTNFASQVLYAGTEVMNYTSVTGWYYINLNARSPSWTSVQYFHDFLLANRGAGPFAEETDLRAIELADFVQLSFDGERFGHTLAVVSIEQPITPNRVLVATHTYDAYGRPLSSYTFRKMRCIHILGYRRP